MPIDIFRISGLAGTGLAILAILFSTLLYRGKQGEKFSLLNHFISELGEVGVSAAARVFNYGLLLGGLFLIPFIIKLGVVLHSVLGWLGAAAGVIAALSVSAVGIFPMNNLQAHGTAAMTYFRSGLVMVFFFGLSIHFQPSGHLAILHSANWLSLAAFLAYAAFLLRMTPKKPKDDPGEAPDPDGEPERPRVWLFAILEWLVFFATIFWLFGMTFFI